MTACSCGCNRPAVCLGRSKTCDARWRRWGRPDTTPEPIPLAEANRPWRDQLHADREARIAEFARRRALGATIAAASMWVGVTEATGKTYAAEIRRRDSERQAA